MNVFTPAVWRNSSNDPADSGIGIIEIVVAMFLVATIALALIPVFTSTMRLSQTNIVVGRAAQVVGSQVSLASAQATLTATCAAITTLAVPPHTIVPGTQNSGLVYERDVSSCPTTYPGVMTVTIIVSKSGTYAELARASTLVAVTGAS